MAEEAARELNVDVAVVGAGPAGLAAATAAAESDARVVVLDEGFRPGGQIWRHTHPDRLSSQARRALRRFARSGATALQGASVTGLSPGRILAHQSGRPLTVATERLILASGARERFLPFPGWTLPNVLGVGGAQALLKSGASFSGRRVVVAGSGPLLLPVAVALADDGADLALVAEQAPAGRVLAFGLGLWRSPGRVLQAARYRLGFRRAPYRTSTWVARAEGGEEGVREVTLTDGRRSWTERCDILCVGYGLAPAAELFRLLGCEVEDGRVVVDEWQRTSVEGVYGAGEPTGIGGMEAARVEGEIAGLAACDRLAEARRRFRERDRHRRFAARLEHAFALRPELRGLPEADTVVCRCEDVRYGQLRPGWTSRQAKLYTRAGMGPCQGRVCGAALQFLMGFSLDTVREPVLPAPVTTYLHTAPAEGGA